MNTPESDMEQMKFAREWVRAHAAKKMADGSTRKLSEWFDGL